MSLFYSQRKEMSDAELLEMYDKYPKKTIIEMLIQCNKVLDKLSPKIYPAK